MLYVSEYVSDKENIDDVKKSVQFELDNKANERPDKSKHRRHLGIQTFLVVPNTVNLFNFASNLFLRYWRG